MVARPACPSSQPSASRFEGAEPCILVRSTTPKALPRSGVPRDHQIRFEFKLGFSVRSRTWTPSYAPECALKLPRSVAVPPFGSRLAGEPQFKFEFELGFPVERAPCWASELGSAIGWRSRSHGDDSSLNSNLDFYLQNNPPHSGTHLSLTLVGAASLRSPHAYTPLRSALMLHALFGRQLGEADAEDVMAEGV